MRRDAPLHHQSWAPSRNPSSNASAHRRRQKISNRSDTKGSNRSTTKGTRSENDDSKPVNKPRNLMVTDATAPLQFAWTGKYRIHHCLTIEQTADQETWPGGAAWDCGWCLAQLLVGIAATTSLASITTHLQKSTHRTIHLPTRVLAEQSRLTVRNASPLLILELGCGVGLTGLVAAAALHAEAVVLTDLPIVIERVTQPNVLLNTTLEKKTNKQQVAGAGTRCGTNTQQHQRRIINKGHSQVIATPLCWGNPEDEQAVASVLRGLDQTTTSSHQHSLKGKGRKKKRTHTNTSESTLPSNIRTPGTPDLILIGDVAYQHEPGAPSHFDALVSTLLKFAVDDHTLVLFGTRIRMPASVDLTELLLEHFDSVVEPPISANEIEQTAFCSVKQNNMCLYFLRRKRKHHKQNAKDEISNGCTESERAECE